MAAEVEPLEGTPTAELGEGPRWIDGLLHWVDIHGRRHHTTDPAAGPTTSEVTDDEVSLVLPRGGGGLLLAVGASVILRDPDGRERLLVRLSEDPAHRCNDGACDPRGRLYIGTMRRDAEGREGRLLRVDPDGRTTEVADGCGIPNGVGFDPARGRMYFVDSRDGGVDVWDLDDDEPRGRRRFVDIDPPAVPDGLVVDADGDVWVAANGGGEVHRYTPAGELVTRIEVPAEQVSACAFGGPALADLYITTAREGFDAAQAQAQPFAGRVFVAPGVGRGVPVTPFAG